MSASDKSTPSSVCGILVLDKPAGRSSMQAVAAVRFRAGRAKTGHAGTLDPLATGVLVLALGRPATRTIPALMGTDKRYGTVIDLSAFTATDDAEAEREPVDVSSPPSRTQIELALSRFRGEFLQMPPNFSAIKVGGRRSYKEARAGRDVALEPRAVTVHDLSIVRYDWPRLELEIECAKGFYVRSLARELGAVLETGGYCRSIRRLAVGPFTIDEAIALEDVPEPLTTEDLIPVDVALERVKAARRTNSGEISESV